MVAKTSTMQALGTLSHGFTLPDVCTHSSVSLSSEIKKPVLLMFICNHCPFVLHIMDELTALANQAQSDGFFVAAISSNDVERYPEDSPEKMADFAKHYGFNFPYLYDESQTIARNYAAVCTPDFFVYDSEHKLVYRGQMDGSRPNSSIPVTGNELRTALTAILNGAKPPLDQNPSIGCSIKWKTED